MTPVIVLSTHNTGLGIIRALGEIDIPVIALYYDKADMGYVSKYVIKRYHIPHPENQINEFIDFLINLSNEFNKSLLLPADDASLVSVSKKKKLLEKYYNVACTDWEITEKFINKFFTYKIAEEAGIPTPRSLLPQSKEDVINFGKKIDYPCMVKPIHSHLFFDHFRVKMFKVYDYEQLIDIYGKIESTDLKVMMQEYIPGDDTNGVNYNSYFWDQRSIVEFTAEKVRLSPPESGVPCVVVSKEIPEIMEMGRSILSSMKFYGYSCIEFKKDIRDGVYKLMEVNGRHNRSTLLAVKCGINFAEIQYNHLVKNISINNIKNQSYEKNIYWIDLLKDIVVSVYYLKQKGYTLGKLLKPYFSKNIFATLNIKDLKPFIKRIFSLLLKIFK